MAVRTAIIVVTIGAVLMPTAAAASFENPFGVILKRDQVGRAAIATSLNVAYARTTPAVFMDEWDGTCASCDEYRSAGLELVLTVRYNGSRAGEPIEPTTPPDDLQDYRVRLGEILDATAPDILVVENEPDAREFYRGSPAQYLETLSAACEVAHARGVACADGG